MKKLLMVVLVVALILTLIACGSAPMNVTVANEQPVEENDINEGDAGTGWPAELPDNVPQPIDVGSISVMTVEDEVSVSFTDCDQATASEYVYQMEASGWEIVSTEDQEGTHLTTAQDAQGNTLTFCWEQDGDYGSIGYIANKGIDEGDDGTGWPDTLPDNVPQPIDVGSISVMTVEDEVSVSFTDCDQATASEYVYQMEASGWEIVSTEDQEGTHLTTAQDAQGNTLTFCWEQDGDYGSIDYIANKGVSEGDNDIAWPDAFPDNVPKPMDANLMDVMPTEGKTSIGFEDCTSDKATEYVAQLEAAGWEIVSSEDQEGTHLYEAQDGDGNTLLFSWEEDGDYGFISCPTDE